MRRVVCVGEAFVDLLAEPEIEDVGRSDRFTRVAGGAVANVAVGIARLGGRAAFAGAVGDDPFGRFLARTLTSEGVDAGGIRFVGAPTPIIFVARGHDGWRDFYPANWPGADTCLAPSDLEPSMFAGAGCVHFGGVTLAAEPGRSACMAAARTGHDAGAIVSFDLNVRPKIWPSVAEMQPVYDMARNASDVVKCSNEDLAALGLGADDPASLLGGATKAAIVTLGARGCRWATADGGRGEAPAPRIAAVDTTGAGDAFMAACLWRLCAREPIDVGAEAIADATRFGVLAGAAACQKEGAIASLPTAREIEAMIASIR